MLSEKFSSFLVLRHPTLRLSSHVGHRGMTGGVAQLSPLPIPLDMATWVQRSVTPAGDDLITWWHDGNIREKRELNRDNKKPEEDRMVVRSPVFEVAVWGAQSDSAIKQPLGGF